jgi:hypothetical protein
MCIAPEGDIAGVSGTARRAAAVGRSAILHCDGCDGDRGQAQPDALRRGNPFAKRDLAQYPKSQRPALGSGEPERAARSIGEEATTLRALCQS